MHNVTPIVSIALTVLLTACAPVTTPTFTAPTSTPPRVPRAVAHTSTPMPTQSFTPTRTATPTCTPIPTPTPIPPSPTPTPTALPDIFRPVAAVGDILPGEFQRLHVTPDGDLWMVTDQGVAQRTDDAWRVRLADADLNSYFDTGGQIVGIDAAGCVWVVSEDTMQISVWDGISWRAYGTDEGWFPVALEDGYRDVSWGQSDGSARFWLATSQDVRVFDGERWTVFTREDMGMDPPLRDNLISEFEIAILSDGEVWVGECEGAAGPLGGQGVRWFDGQTWHGADSPVASGCVTAIVAEDSAEDSSGRIWVGVGADVWVGVEAGLWRYDSASEGWARFTPPEPPDPPPLGQWRYAAVADIALDPSDDPWVTFLICGAASCDTMVLYHVHEGAWTRVRIPRPVTLVLDAAGTPWLFSVNGVFRVAGDAPESVADLYARSFTVDASGQVWFLARHEGQDWLWTLDTGTEG